FFLIFHRPTRPNLFPYTTLFRSEMLSSVANIKLQHIPYRGGAPALVDLLAGHVNTIFLSPVSGLEYMKAGKLTGLALAATKRIEDRKSTRLNSSHSQISYAVFCL